MWIKGFIQTDIDEAVFGNVHVVKDIRRYPGECIGVMELTNGDDIIVKRHPCGTLNGSIVVGGIK